VINRALEVYAQKENWAKLVKRCMESDFSWAASAKEYIKMYDGLLEKK
jgi:starch synthase